MRLAPVLVMLASLVSGGCASLTLAPHQTNIESISALRDGGLSKVAVADFSVARALEGSAGRELKVRGHVMRAPNGGTFAQYLKESLTTDLRAADKLDSAAPRVIAAELTENTINAAGISQATSSLAAHFRVMQGDRSLFDKELRVEHSWESAFTGMLAIPAAVDQYTEQYTRLLNQLYRDQEFQKACSAPSPRATP